MNSNKPFFSIVTPTYNRANLLGNAIKSVIQQSFDDIELIICNSASTDNTREVVNGFNDNRIRYVETNEKLSIGDNYQHALSQTTGEYITFLSDDDAFVPLMLERVKRVIDKRKAKMVAFRVCNYYQKDEFEYGLNVPANSLEIPEFDSRISEFTPLQSLKLLFAKHGFGNNEEDKNFIVPYLANAVYHHTIFNRVQEKKIKLFAETPSDMYLAAAVFYVLDSYFCLNEPLHVWSRWGGNMTALPGQNGGNNLRQHFERLLNGRKLEFTPLKFALLENCTVNAILTAKNDFENINNSISVNWFQYFVRMYHSLAYLKFNNINVEEEMAEFHKVLSIQSPELQNKVRAKLQAEGHKEFQTVVSNAKHYTKKAFRDIFPSSVEWLKHLMGHKEETFCPNIINGNESGFYNVLEAANFVGNKLPTTVSVNGN